jgi:O-antigen ligase
MAALLLRRTAAAIRPVIAMAALCGLFLAVVGPGVVWQRFREPDPYSARREYLAASISMARARPWTGFGLGTWADVYPAYAVMDDGTSVNRAHNDYAQAAAEGGAAALGCLAALLLWTIWAGIRIPWGWGLTCVLLHAWVDYPIDRPALGAFYFLFAGLVAAASQKAGRVRNAKRAGQASSWKQGPGATVYPAAPRLVTDIHSYRHAKRTLARIAIVILRFRSLTATW